MGTLTLDATQLVRVLPAIGFDGDRERLPCVPGVQAHRHGTAGPDPVNAGGGPLDVGRVDVSPGHDDHVLDPAAHHDVAGFREIAQVACVVPTVLILGGEETAGGRVPLRHRFAAHVNDADTASRQHIAVVVDDAGFQSLQRTSDRGKAPGVTPGCWDG